MEEPMELLQVRAVLFDMDGTLVTSDEAVERAWTTWAHEYGVDPAAVLAIAHGSPAEATADRMLPGLPWAVVTSADRQLAKARLGAHVELTDLHQLAGLLAG
jgi:sugar-phosphatase